MKIATLVLATLISTPAFATSLAPLVCNNMKNDEMTDSFKQVTLLNGNVDFQNYENFISATSAETVVSGNTVAVINKKLKGAVEGDEYEAVANALVVYNKKTNKLLVTLILDGQVEIQEELTCGK